VTPATWIAFGSLLALLFVQTASIAYFLGTLSSRARSNTDRIDKLENSEFLERMAKMETEMSHLRSDVQKIDRHVEGANRQLAALASRRRGAVPPLDTIGDE
jgi:hypothetical protein